jgi:hypothetical protein
MVEGQNVCGSNDLFEFGKERLKLFAVETPRDLQSTAHVGHHNQFNILSCEQITASALCNKLSIGSVGHCVIDSQ